MYKVQAFGSSRKQMKKEKIEESEKTDTKVQMERDK